LTDGPPAEPTKPEEAPTYLPAPPPPLSDSTSEVGQPAGGPPGSGVFSLDRRPGAGLYLLAWLLSVGGVALIFIGLQATGGPAGLLILFGLAALALGLATGAGYQVLARRSRPATAFRGPSPLLLFALVIVVVNLFGGIVSVLTGGGGLDVDRPDVFLVGLVIQIFAYVGLVWLFVVRTGALTWSDLVEGNRPPHEKDRLAALGTGIGVMAPVTILALIIGGLAALLLDARPPQVVPLPQTPVDVAIDFLAAVILAPLGEELFFRGYSLTAWWRDLGPRSALIRSAVFFALVHILNLQVDPGDFFLGLRGALVLLIVLLPIGFVLGGLFIRRGLFASVAAHMTYNGIVFGLLLLSTTVPTPTG
jgi:membrane protease YdiL (CAAX protease family)